MAYSDVQNLQKEFPKLSETDSMGWKQMFVV